MVFPEYRRERNPIMHPLPANLWGGDRRSIGRSNEVISRALRNPSLFPILFSGLYSDNEILRMRVADAMEKVTTQRPDLLSPFRAAMLRDVARIAQQEVRWHLAQMLSRLRLTPHEGRTAVQSLRTFLQDRSSIVKTSSMQALADIARRDTGLRGEVIRQIQGLTRTGTPAMRAPGKKLLAGLRERQRPVQPLGFTEPSTTKRASRQ